MVAVGDIARIRRWAGLWAVTGQLERTWRLSQWNGLDKAPTGLDRGEGDLEILGHPTFTPGQVVQHWGQAVRVVADLGEKVCVYIERRKKVEGGFINFSGETPLDRGALVAENAAKLLRILESQT